MNAYSAKEQPYIDPAFARYDDKLSAAMTHFLYADPTSPVASMPERWHRSGAVIYINRTLFFNDVGGGGGTDSQRFSIVGGKNSIVFAKMISVLPQVAAAPETLPNERAAYVNIQVKRSDGMILDEDQSAANTYGSGQWPYTYPSPDFWPGTVERIVTVTNNNVAAVDIYLNWTVAILDTGR